MDLSAYKRPQMERRIQSFMAGVGAADFPQLVRMVEADRELYRRFVDHLTINVSEFFRNPQHWEVLRERVIPMLLARRRPLQVWSAGCSTGEEPYSLALLMREYFPGACERILATDIDAEALERAAAGRYRERVLEQVPRAMLERYFQRDGAGLRVNDSIRSMVRFQRHDLVRDPPPPAMDLILCRNVVIYFTESAREHVYRGFVRALRPGGVLFVGSTEQVFQAAELGLEHLDTFFYRAVGAGPLPHGGCSAG
jgi:chemotaxis protein methyltransferase CheR